MNAKLTAPAAFLLSSASILLGGAASCAADEPTAEQVKFFESKIRPVLIESCYKCHSESAEKIKGGLVLDTRDGTLKGGENGPAVVPGDLEKSLLITAIRYEDEDKAMPPKNKGGKLPDAVIADFEAWVKMGAPDPRTQKAKAVASKKYDGDTQKKWWAFQPVKKPSIPQPQDDAKWARTDIDRFILAEYESKKLMPVADAGRHTLLRRASIDITGLPPSAEQIERFVNDKDPKAFERAIDEMLASPRYGERWGRHWLDVARYAETSGRDLNLVFPEAWRFRDYVVDSFDQDKPFDQFIREQLAGDLLPDKSDEERAKNLTATGFLAIGPKPMNESIARQFAVDHADEQIDATSLAFMGVSIACARCHEHKFDPISQRDYTALAGIFLSTETRFGTPGGNQARNASSLIEMPPTVKVAMPGRRMDPNLWRRKNNALQDYIAQRNEELRNRGLAGANLQVNNAGKVVGENGRGPRKGGLTDFDLVRISTIAAQLEAEVSIFNADGSPKPMVMAVLDKPGPGERPRQARGGGGPKKRSGFENIGDSPFFVRGDIRKEIEKVPRGLPEFLSHGAKVDIPPNESGRLQLANWIASPENVLTARVYANRVWHWLFGRGIVASVDNFGTTGTPPSNQALLDHLATRFVELGWSPKKLIREIMLSRVYQLSSAMDEKNFTIDSDNIYCWRMNQRRMDAESIRDSMLFASGALDLKRRAGSLLADVGEGPVGGPRNKVIVEDDIIRANGNFRSLYLPIARAVSAETLSVFDFSDPSVVLGARQVTTVPPQSLYLMNSDFVSQQSETLAKRVMSSATSLDERIKLASMLVWSRLPTDDELAAARDYVMKHHELPDSEAAWTSVCRSFFGAAEFRYLD